MKNDRLERMLHLLVEASKLNGMYIEKGLHSDIDNINHWFKMSDSMIRKISALQAKIYIENTYKN